MAAMAALGRRSPSFLLSVKALQPESSIFCRFLNAAPKADDDIVKKVFIRQQKNFRTYLEEISKEKFDMDHNNQNSVKAYYEMQARIRENLGIPSFTQKIADLLDGAAEEAPDVRSILVLNKSLRHEAGIEDDMGADDMMFKALAKVEKALESPLRERMPMGFPCGRKKLIKLMRRDVLQTLVGFRLKIKDEDLEMLEEEAEFAAAKAELEKMGNVAFDKIDSIKRRDDIKVDVSLSDIDHRTYL